MLNINYTLAILPIRRGMGVLLGEVGESKISWNVSKMQHEKGQNTLKWQMTKINEMLLNILVAGFLAKLVYRTGVWSKGDLIDEFAYQVFARVP